MPLGKSPILQNDLMASGDNQKYLLFNDAIVRLEDAANRALTIDMSSGNAQVSQSQMVSFGMFWCTGHTVARTLTLPITVATSVETNRIVAVRNDGTGTVTVTHDNSGSTLGIPTGETALLYCDGTDILSLGGVANAATMPLLDDGVESVPAMKSLNIDGTGYTISDDGDGGATITFAIPESLIDLDDVPTDLTGQSGKFLSVASGEDVFELVDAPVMTGAAIKTAYEGQADTNAFTDTEKTKLSNIENNATADQTGSEIVTAIDTELGGSAWQSGGGTMTGSEIVTAIDTELGSSTWQSGGGTMTGAAIVSAIDTELGSSDWQSGGGSGGTSLSVVAEAGATHAVTDGNLGGGVLLRMTNGSANTVTVASGLTGTEPLTIVQAGAGTTTIVAGGGVTINSLDSLTAIAGQFGSATLIPLGSDVYDLVGALA